MLYYRDGSEIMIQGFDEEYDESKKAEIVKVKFKYPSQGDCNLIARHAQGDMTGEDFTVQNFQNIEFTRILVLIRDWSLGKEVNNENILSLHPKIIKGIAAKLREEIGIDGIV